MLAGSLMSGCSFDVTCFSIHGELGRGCCKFVGPKRVIWHACCPQFGHLGDHRATQGDLGAHGGVPGLDFYRFGREFGAASGRFWPTLEQRLCFWHACLQVTFFKDFGV